MLSTLKEKNAASGAGGCFAGAATRRYSLSLLIGALFSPCAMAALSDTIHPFLSTSISYDDNLLRLSDAPFGQDGGRSDTFKRVDGGLLLERPIGRQVLAAKATLSRVEFSRHQRLNYNAKDLSAGLKWQLGNHLSGNLGGSYVETLAPFSDYHNDQRNLRDQKKVFVDGTWRFHPSWQVRGAARSEKFNYDLTTQHIHNRTEDVSEAGLDYLPASGSRVGVLVRRVKASYLAAPTGDYVQSEAKANIYWAFSGTSQMTVIAGWVQRKHEFLVERDESGFNGRLIVGWKPLGKVRFNAAAWREFSVVEANDINTALTTGASVGATWDATAKVKVETQLRRENRKFNLAENSAVTGNATDTSNNATLGVSYAPTPSVTLSVNGFRDMRSGSQAAGTNSYRANGVSLNATGQF